MDTGFGGGWDGMDVTQKKVQKEFDEVVAVLQHSGFDGLAIPGSLALKKRLDKQGIAAHMHLGFIVLRCESEAYALRHVWIDSCDRKWDVASEVNIRKLPMMRMFDFELADDLPEGVERTDLDTEKEKAVAVELENGFNKLKSEEGYEEQYIKEMSSHGWSAHLIKVLFDKQEG